MCKNSDPAYRDEYCETVSRKFSEKEISEESPQEKWNFLVETCLESAKETIGTVKNSNKSDSADIKSKSEKQLKLRKELYRPKQER